ncbi:MAG: PQQ-binding-like beta-propeller repeat protein [Dokdonella sp.]|uniref:outer membrane protein assembly factor BamB family protein n=1 Tax=Dokdonella sp. TaxID=2291710 RepID=UPI003263D389
MLPSTMIAAALSAATTLMATSPAGAADWLQFGYDASHSGSNTAETTLGATNVTSLAQVYSVSLPHSSDSSAVFLGGVTTPTGIKDLLFIVAKGGYLFAIDAANGSVLWSKQPASTGGNLTTGAPAIDPNRQFVYAYGLDGNVHKYAVGDGTETITGGWPQVSSLKTNAEKGAAALAISSPPGGAHYLYSVIDGYIGDGGDYQGHVTTINLASGSQTVFNVNCSDVTVHFATGGKNCTNRQSGIWGRPGAVYDAGTNRIYVATGNGPFTPNAAGHFSWGDSVLALAPDGTGAGGGMPRDSWTPDNFQHLQNSDIDLGSVSPAILPAPGGSAVAHLALQAGKDGQLRLIDLGDMSGQGDPGHVGGELQLLDVPQGGNGYGGDLMREQPAVWVDPSDGSTWVFVSNGSGSSGLQLGLGTGNVPALTVRWTKSGSANGASSPMVANGVVYSSGNCAGGTCINARNPHTGDILWSSPHIGSVHWQSPILVNGAIYMVDGTSKLWKFAAPQSDVIFDDGFEG